MGVNKQFLVDVTRVNKQLVYETWT